MNDYIDAFVFPIDKKHLKQYKEIAEQVAEIWKEYGALAYFEYIGDDLSLEATRSFPDAIASTTDEEVIFGWVVFPSKEVRNKANKKVPLDARMTKLVAPLFKENNKIFDAGRMVYGGFKPFINSQ